MSHRVTVTLSDAQYVKLLHESRLTGLSVSEVARRAMQRMYGEAPSRRTALEALETSAGAWRDRSFDGGGYVEGLRRGLGRRLRQ